MSLPIAVLLAAGVGFGVALILASIRGRHWLVPTSRPRSARSFGGRKLVMVTLGVVVGVVVLLITRWPVAGLAAAFLVASGNQLFPGRSERDDEIARTQAVASWTETVRDNMAGAAGLEQALVATATIPPAAIAPEVNRFVDRLETMPLDEALIAFGDDIANPSADMVVAALANAARMESRELGPLLTKLSESIRGDVRMRLRVEVGRARIRTSARIVTGVTIFVASFIYLFSRPLLSVYDSLTGQLYLSMVLAVFAAGAWLMNHYSKIEMPERFSASSRAQQDQESDEPVWSDQPGPFSEAVLNQPFEGLR